MNRYLILFTLLLVSQIQCGVMQITLNNLRNVIATYEQILILFHNPQCIHSRKYVQSFLKIDSTQKLGLVDCLREIQLCHKYNFTQFPVLAKIDNKDNPQVVDEQEFLVNHGLRDGTQDEVLVNKFISYLDQDPSYAVVVFEDYGLPAMTTQRISESEERIFYLQPYTEQNPSNFTKLLSSFVNQKHGCWIFTKSAQNKLQKYSCDSGYDKNITKKLINLFKQNKLKKYVFSEDQQFSNSNSVKQYTAEDMNTILQKIERVDSRICTVVYVSSSKCLSCREKDIVNIQLILKELNINHVVAMGKFSIDKNEIPPKLVKLGLKRVPELFYFCNQKIKVFGEIFFLESIREFLEIHHFGKEEKISVEKPQQQQTIDQVGTKQQEF